MPRQYGIPSWILASEVILEEAVATLHRTYTFAPIRETQIGDHMRDNMIRRAARKNPLLVNKSIRKVKLIVKYALVSNWGIAPRLYWTPWTENKRFIQVLERLDARDLELELQAESVLVSETDNNMYHALFKEALEVLCGRCRSMTVKLDILLERHRNDVWRLTQYIDTAIAAAEDCVQMTVGSNMVGAKEVRTAEGKGCVDGAGLISAHLERVG
jgi:hypothetical protein